MNKMNCKQRQDDTRLTDIFQDNPRKPVSYLVTILTVLELRMEEVMVTTGAIRCANLQSNRQHQQTSTQLFTGWIPFLPPNQQC